MKASLPANPHLIGVGAGEAQPTIADHVLIRRIGKGAYGDVWLARNVIGGFHAAKVIYRKRFSDNRPFEREFEGICKYEPISRTHPGLVTVLQVGENPEAGYFYYVMELADDPLTGQKIETNRYTPRTLSQVMAHDQRIPLDKSLPISLSLASALGYLHSQKLIHRDIKPSNIIFVNGQVKFADIGLMTEAGEGVSSVGSAGYMPPEGPGESTGDIYSLGKVFYGMFMGQSCKSFPELPGAAEEFTSTPALRQINDVILKACHHDPRERFQTAEDLHEALVSVTETARGKPPGIGATLPVRRVTTGNATGNPERQPDASGEQRPKARWPLVVGLFVLLVAIAGAVFFFFARNEHVLVFMDTTAEHGIYDPDNKKNGNSNAKEVAEALRIPDFREVLPPEKMHEVPVGLNWARKDHVRTLRPHLLIVHRSVFYHPWAAELSLPYPPFKTDEEFKAFARRYSTLGDNPLREFLGDIGNAVPRTRFVVYSRGTDTNWLSETYRQSWVKELESQHPALAGRVTPMLIPGDTNGTFRSTETRFLLRSNVVEILNLPKKGDPAKRN